MCMQIKAFLHPPLRMTPEEPVWPGRREPSSASSSSFTSALKKEERPEAQHRRPGFITDLPRAKEGLLICPVLPTAVTDEPSAVHDSDGGDRRRVHGVGWFQIP